LSGRFVGTGTGENLNFLVLDLCADCVFPVVAVATTGDWMTFAIAAPYGS
jgi:nitrate reductase NapE component